MTTTEDIQANLHFMDMDQANVVAYTIDNSPNGEIAEKIMVVYNGNSEVAEVTLPEGNWNVCVNGEKAGTEVLSTAEGTVSVDGISAMVLVQGDTAPAAGVLNGVGASSGAAAGNGTVLIIATVAILGVGGAVFAVKRKKNK